MSASLHTNGSPVARASYAVRDVELAGLHAAVRLRSGQDEVVVFSHDPAELLDIARTFSEAAIELKQQKSLERDCESSLATVELLASVEPF